MEADSQMGDPREVTPPPPAGVFDELSKLLALARESLSDILELVSLETRRAGLGVVWMIVSGLLATLFILTAWAGLMAVLAMSMVSFGMLPIAAVIAVAAVNLVAGAGMLYCAYYLSRRLLFAATRRQLTGVVSVRSSAP